MLYTALFTRFLPLPIIHLIKCTPSNKRQVTFIIIAIDQVVSDVFDQPRSQLSSAISDVRMSPLKLVERIRTWFQASFGNSDSANWPGYEAGV